MMSERIQTERLVLRPWMGRDAEEMFVYASVEGWSPYNPIPKPYTRHDAETYIASQILSDPKKLGTWAIEREGRLIGGIECRWLADGRIGNLGYAIARDHGGKGYGTEAVRAVVDEAFQSRPELQRINASLHHENRASARVLEKAGFTREGVLRKNTLMYGVLADQVWYGLLREEWEAARGAAS